MKQPHKAGRKSADKVMLEVSGVYKTKGKRNYQ